MSSETERVRVPREEMDVNDVGLQKYSHPMKTTHTHSSAIGREQGECEEREGSTFQQSPATPAKSVDEAPRRVGRGAALQNGDSAMQTRAMAHSMNAPGIQTFNQKYMPFAAGFAHMYDEAAVYRSSRLHAINPTAAVTDDVSYYWTLDSGRTTAAVAAANPDMTEDEFVRNTRTAARGGFVSSLMKPIK